jgi:large subunit ribosomal protein L18
VINDHEGRTLCAASSLDKELREQLKRGSNVKAASAVGQLIATRAKEKGIAAVVFDRGGFRYHGRVKALGRRRARERAEILTLAERRVEGRERT